MEYVGFKDTRADRIFTFFNYTFLLSVLLIVLYPLIFILSSSFSSTDAVRSGAVWLWPVDFSLDGYIAVFKHQHILTGFRNSFFYIIFGTAFNVILTILAAYPLSRKEFFGRKFFMLLFVFTMMFDGGLIPRYLLIRDVGLLDSRWVLIIPFAINVWNMIITRTYFKTTISDELLNAAQIDGCDDFTFLRKIVIPLSAPIIAVIALFYAVEYWNQFFNALIFLKDRKLYPLQLILNEILVQNTVDMTMIQDAGEISKKLGLRELLKYSLIVVASFPLLVIYPFVQKYFVKGVMIGSLKE